MLKNIFEVLKLSGVSVPTWIFTILLIVLIVGGFQILWSKYLKKWFKKIFKIEDNIGSIEILQKDLSDEIKRASDRDIEIDEKIAKLDDKLDSIVGSLASIQKMSTEQITDMAAQKEALKMMLCNELDKRYRRYLQLGHIPAEEFDEYNDMYDVYHNGLHGNHTGTQKYNYVINNLKVK